MSKAAFGRVGQGEGRIRPPDALLTGEMGHVRHGMPAASLVSRSAPAASPASQASRRSGLSVVAPEHARREQMKLSQILRAPSPTRRPPMGKEGGGSSRQEQPAITVFATCTVCARSVLVNIETGHQNREYRIASVDPGPKRRFPDPDYERDVPERIRSILEQAYSAQKEQASRHGELQRSLSGAGTAPTGFCGSAATGR